MTEPATLRPLAVFALFWCALLLLTPREFYRLHPGGRGYSDGYIEYLVGRTIAEEGRASLPLDYDKPERSRVTQGRDGRLYAVFGIGNPLLFAATELVDGWLPSGVEPGFASLAANSLTTALTATLLVQLLLALGIGPRSALLAALSYVFGSMALAYSRLPFNMPLHNALLLASLLLLVRGASGAGRGWRWAGAGACFGAALLVRLPAAIFAAPIGLYLLLVRPPGQTRAWLRDVAGFGVAALPFAVGVLAFNAARFGSPLDTGYTGAVKAFAFNARWSDTLPVLLVSPGRGVLWFSPLLVLALLGLYRFARARPREAWLLLGVALLNLLFYAKNRAWITAHAWGARFQLLLVLALTVPLGFWIDTLRARGRLVFALALGLCAALQLLWVAQPHPASALFVDDLWMWDRSQLVTSLERLARWAAQGAVPGELNFWWTSPAARSPAMLALGAGLLAGVALAASRLWRRAPPAAAGETA